MKKMNHKSKFRMLVCILVIVFAVVTLQSCSTKDISKGNDTSASSYTSDKSENVGSKDKDSTKSHSSTFSPDNKEQSSKNNDETSSGKTGESSSSSSASSDSKNSSVSSNNSNGSSSPINSNSSNNSENTSVSAQNSASENNSQGGNEQYSNQSEDNNSSQNQSTAGSNNTNAYNNNGKSDTSQSTCTFLIDCNTALGYNNLSDSLRSVLPSNGVIYSGSVSINDGDSVFDLLYKITRDNGIPMEFSASAAYGSKYIEGINSLYEFDCGELSGWTYYVNGVRPNYGCDKYKLSHGDDVRWYYTTDLGNDINF